MSKAKRIPARQLLRSFGINNPNGSTYKRYVQRMKSAKKDELSQQWTVLETEADPRLPEGRQKGARA